MEVLKGEVASVVKSDYHLRNKYRLVLLNGENVILDINATNRMQKATPGTTDICVPLAWEDYFGVLFKTHEELAHMLTGRKLHDKVKGSYPSVSRVVCDKFVDLCPFCNERVKKWQSPARAPPVHIIEEQFGSRGQVDLIDMSKEPDGLFKYILNYQDIGASASAHAVWSAPLFDMLVAMVQRRSLSG